MKLYYFNPNTCGQEYTVMSDSKENAFNTVVNYLKKERDKYLETENEFGYEDEDEMVDFLSQDYNLWKSHTVDNLSLQYTIDEYDVDQVIHTEIS